VLAVAVLVVVVFGISAVGLAWHGSRAGKSAGPIPASMRRQIDFALIVPYEESTIGNDISYDQSRHTLSYTWTAPAGRLVVSQQPTPPQFADIKGYEQKVYDSFNQYDTFHSQLGEVHLTRPGQQGNSNMAAVNTNGTLMFVTAPKQLAGPEWQAILAALHTLPN
jgi:hypothetical protein